MLFPHFVYAQKIGCPSCRYYYSEDEKIQLKFFEQTEKEMKKHFLERWGICHNGQSKPKIDYGFLDMNHLLVQDWSKSKDPANKIESCSNCGQQTLFECMNDNKMKEFEKDIQLIYIWDKLMMDTYGLDQATASKMKIYFKSISK